MSHFFKFIFFDILIIISTTVYSQEGKWELEKESGNIKIYTRKVESSNIKEFKAQGLIHSPASTIVEILKDVGNYPLWIEDVHSSRVLSDNPNLTFYYQLHLPWPIKNRDVAMAMNITTNLDKSTLLELTSIASTVPDKEDFIRIKQVNGYWYVKALDKKSSEVTYQFLADPEGFLPAWVINIFIVDGPFKTLQNLRDYSANK